MRSMVEGQPLRQPCGLPPPRAKLGEELGACHGSVKIGCWQSRTGAAIRPPKPLPRQV